MEKALEPSAILVGVVGLLVVFTRLSAWRHGGYDRRTREAIREASTPWENR